MEWDCLCILLPLSKGVREASESYKAGMRGQEVSSSAFLRRFYL